MPGFPASISKHRAAVWEILGQAVRDPGRSCAVRTRGASMEPLLRTRDEVVIRAVPASEIAIGDIIAYRSGELLIVHRVGAILRRPEGLLFYERGDNSLALTGVPAESVLGVATEVVVGERRVRLRDPRFRRLGACVAWYGLRACRVYGIARRAGRRVLPGGGMAVWANRLAHALLLGPTWPLLALARRYL